MSEKQIEEILNEIRKTKQELKSTIEAVEVNILLKIEETNRRIIKLENQNKEFEEALENLEIVVRKNNIIIFGLKEVQQITPKSICEELKKLLDIEVHLSDLNAAHPLGKKENSPLKVEFLSYLKKVSILKNVNKLKGTNIFITNDLTPKQRTENRILRKHLHLAQQNNNNKCFIRKHKLHVNNVIYAPSDLENFEETFQDNYIIKPRSAPETPTPLLTLEVRNKNLDGMQQIISTETSPIPTTPVSEKTTEKNQFKGNVTKKLKDVKKSLRSTSTK